MRFESPDLPNRKTDTLLIQPSRLNLCGVSHAEGICFLGGCLLHSAQVITLLRWLIGAPTAVPVECPSHTRPIRGRPQLFANISPPQAPPVASAAVVVVGTWSERRCCPQVIRAVLYCDACIPLLCFFVLYSDQYSATSSVQCYVYIVIYVVLYWLSTVVYSDPCHAI